MSAFRLADPKEDEALSMILTNAFLPLWYVFPTGWVTTKPTENLQESQLVPKSQIANRADTI
jgi:hypothetical protein